MFRTTLIDRNRISDLPFFKEERKEMRSCVGLLVIFSALLPPPCRAFYPKCCPHRQRISRFRSTGGGNEEGASKGRKLLEKCLVVTEIKDATLRREMRALGLDDKSINYAMEERKKRKPPPAGTPMYKGLTAWWCDKFGIDID